MSNERFIVTIETLDGFRTAERRLRNLLKSMPRLHGFRVLAVRLAEQPDCGTAAKLIRQLAPPLPKKQRPT